MLKNFEDNGTEEIVLVTPTRGKCIVDEDVPQHTIYVFYH